jgi:predicted SAM-dependent methyltransferase
MAATSRAAAIQLLQPGAAERMGPPMIWANIGSGTHRAPLPWVNCDIRQNEDTIPDILTTLEEPFPFEPASCERILLSHVLEHLELWRLPDFFDAMALVMAPGCEVLIIGPDTYRTLERWNAGQEPFTLLTSVMEHASYPGTTDWPNASHQWNCHEVRVMEMLELEGFSAEPLERPPDDWPSWHWAGWQFCVRATLEER